MAEKVSFLQVDSFKMSSAPIKEGQLIFTTDNHKLYRDINGERVPIKSGNTSIISSSKPNNLETGDLWFIEEG